ncbi:hypothetical protein Hanom_Chr04g00345161 [Helianthus anomalus]
MDLAFDLSVWNIDGWKLALLNLGGDGDMDQVMALEAGPSGAKDQKEAGGEAGGEKETGGEAVIVGDEGC